jgi:hypothetical protein
MFSTNVDTIKHILVSILLISIFATFFQYRFAYAQQDEEKGVAEVNTAVVSEDPKIKDPTLKSEVIARGPEFPTSNTFVGPDDILVLEKNKGTIKRIFGGQILEEPLLDVNVATDIERGMLGIAIKKDMTMKYPNILESGR